MINRQIEKAKYFIPDEETERAWRKQIDKWIRKPKVQVPQCYIEIENEIKKLTNISLSQEEIDRFLTGTSLFGILSLRSHLFSDITHRYGISAMHYVKIWEKIQKWNIEAEMFQRETKDNQVYIRDYEGEFCGILSTTNLSEVIHKKYSPSAVFWDTVTGKYLPIENLINRIEDLIRKNKLPFSTSERNTGWIYILGNSHMPGLLKIGRTDRTSYERIEELSSATGIPTPFVLVWQEEVSNSVCAEKEIHEYLHEYRVSEGREFFKVDTCIAVDIVKSIATRYPVEEEYRATDLNVLQNWEEEDALLVRALQIVQISGSIDPRTIRMQLGVDFERSRLIFEKLQALGSIDKCGFSGKN